MRPPSFPVNFVLSHFDAAIRVDSCQRACVVLRFRFRRRQHTTLPTHMCLARPRFLTAQFPERGGHKRSQRGGREHTRAAFNARASPSPTSTAGLHGFSWLAVADRLLSLRARLKEQSCNAPSSSQESPEAWSGSRQRCGWKQQQTAAHANMVPERC